MLIPHINITLIIFISMTLCLILQIIFSIFHLVKNIVFIYFHIYCKISLLIFCCTCIYGNKLPLSHLVWRIKQFSDNCELFLFASSLYISHSFVKHTSNLTKKIKKYTWTQTSPPPINILEASYCFKCCEVLNFNNNYPFMRLLNLFILHIGIPRGKNTLIHTISSYHI